MDSCINVKLGDIMVREMSRKGERLYICEACDFSYTERSWAEKCEDYCTKHSACSFEITKHATQMRS